MKRVISILAALLVVASTGMAAFAHGGCHGGGYGRGYSGSRQQRHAVCELEGCELDGRHLHNGSWYCGQTGDQAYAACPVEGCALYGLHRHGRTYYHCAHYGSTISK